MFSVYLHCVNFGRKALEEHIDAIPVAEDVGTEEAYNDSLVLPDEREDSTQDDSKVKTVEEVHTNGKESDEPEESNVNDHSTWEPGTTGFRDKFLVDLYLLADKLMDTVTANMAVDKLIRMTEARGGYPGPELVSYVYRSTTVKSPLRRLFRDWYIFSISESWVDALHQNAFPHVSLKDLVYEIYTLQRNNQGKKTRNLFAPERLTSRRPKDHYHQKPDKISEEAMKPEPHQQE